MGAVMEGLRGLIELPGAIADTGFSRTRDGRLLFAPYGEWGGSYIIETTARFRRMRKQLSWLCVIPCVGFLVPSLFYFHLSQKSGFEHFLIVVGGAFSLFGVIFWGWVFTHTRSMIKLPVGEQSIPAQDDTMGAATASIQNWLEWHTGLDRFSHILSVSGGLVGFACHMALRITADSEQQRIDLTEITLKDGRLLYFGDALNGPLFENTTSIWSIAGDGISKAEVQKMVAEGIAILTSAPSPYLRSIVSATKRLWPVAAELLDANAVPSASWHLVIARAIRAIQTSQNELTPEEASRVVLHSAILMSRWNPADLLSDG